MSNSKDEKRPVEKIRKARPSGKKYEPISSIAAGEDTLNDQDTMKKEKYRDHLEELIKERTAELTKTREVMKLQALERNKAEQTLREIEREQSTVLDNLSDLIVYRNRDMETVWASKSMADWHGMTQEQIVGRVCYKARYGRNEPCEDCHIVEAMKSGKRRELEIQLPDGKYWHVIVNPAFNDSGEIVGTIEVSQDITERKQSEEALKDSEGKLNAMLKSLCDHMSMMDKDLNIIWANDMAKRRFGDDIIGKKCYEVYHGRQNPCEPFPCLTLKAFQDSKVHEHDTQVVDKDGNTRSFHCSANVALRDSEGKPTAVLEISRDITDQKGVEQALWESEKSYRTVVENAAEGIVVVQGETLKFVNPALVSMVGYSKEELLTRPFIEFIHPDHRDQAMGIHIKRLKGEEVPPVYEFKVIDKKGNVKWLENNGILIEWCEKPATLNFLRDVTERRKAEQAIWASESEKRSILNAISDHIIFHDTDLLIRWGNEAAAKSIGMTQRELVGRHCYELWQGRSEPCEGCPVLTAIETGSHTEGIMTTPDGKWWEIIGEPVLDRDGEIRGAIEISRDITERKEAEQALQESEEHFRAIFENALVGLYRTTPDGRILMANPALVQMLDYSSFEELTQLNLEEEGFASNYQRSVFKQRVEAEGQIVGLESRWMRRDGTTLFVRESARAVRDKDDKILYYEGTVVDLTERKRAEEALGESEEKFRSLAEQSPNMIFINKKGRIVYVNKKCEEITGYEREELCSPDFDFRSLVAPESLGLINENFARHLRGEEVQPYDYSIINKDGKRIEAINASKLIQYEGETAILGIVTDITKRTKSEQALRESEERLKILFESAPDAIYLIDSEGRFMDANKAALELVGFAGDEAIGKNLAELGLLSDVQLSRAKENLKKVITGKLSGPNEYTLKRKDGSYISVEVRTFPVKIAGEMLTLGIARNITEHKHAEKILLDHRAQLKSLASQLSLTEERERHRLATDLHDQISQSLVISKIKLDQLRKSNSSGDFKEALDEISKYIGQVIEETRTLTFDLSSPILYELGFEAAVAEWLTDQIQERHRIETEFEDDGRQKPLDDDIRVLLFRNVRELLINVVKHAKAHKVKVSTRRIGEYISVGVEDDGVGFDPVEVASSAVKKAEFGLFSIQERLEQLGGQIEIESGPGRGTKITMTAPLKCKDISDGT